MHVVIVHGYEKELPLFQIYVLKDSAVKCHDRCNNSHMVQQNTYI